MKTNKTKPVPVQAESRGGWLPASGSASMRAGRASKGATWRGRQPILHRGIRLPSVPKPSEDNFLQIFSRYSSEREECRESLELSPGKFGNKNEKTRRIRSFELFFVFNTQALWGSNPVFTDLSQYRSNLEYAMNKLASRKTSQP